MMEYVAGVFLLLGGVLAVIAALGLLRLPDILIRMHASTKVGTLSCGLIMAGVAVAFATGPVVLRCVAIVVFLLLTAPIAGHMIGRAALRTGVPLWQRPDAGNGESEKT
ncbi:monovalent cation/H(+) antiporter subunit G [Thalassococcus sp. S3]|uniref:monovalent cation/H(+) antiporter subunit G n=1 Tax=Thalassococcus sp. S3 TaxID=2017482 RepID=UPI0010241F5D|nr:monovalent cation/H(+) antiporter subunit G [Thalassococcus sp. S3]QBF30995.1 Na+/H+ antiporter subunit G [Thalassococcus sp. S3]